MEGPGVSSLSWSGSRQIPFSFHYSWATQQGSCVLGSRGRENPKQEAMETEGWLSWCTCSYLSQLIPRGLLLPGSPGTNSPPAGGWLAIAGGHTTSHLSGLHTSQDEAGALQTLELRVCLSWLCLCCSCGLLPFLGLLHPALSLLDFVIVASLPVSLALENHRASELECFLLASPSLLSDKTAETLRGDMAPCPLCPSPPNSDF